LKLYGRKESTGGRLIVFEGPDGVGKTTLSLETTRLLNERGQPSEYFAFPGREPDTVGRLVYDIHHSRQGIQDINPTAVQVLHVAAHVDAIERRIRPRLARGVDVILDRYWWSTWVYGVADGIDPYVLQALIDFEERVWDRILPAVVILVQRDSPLNRPDEQQRRWQKLATEYANLAKRVQVKQRVERVVNSGDLSTALNAVLSVVANARNECSPFVASAVRERRSRKKVIEMPPNPRLELGPQTIGQPTVVADIARRGPTVLLHLEPAKPTQVLDTYWRFAAERQRVFFCRAEGERAPWTEDPILRTYKFTNAYRASDRVSQYLIRHVIYRDDLPTTIEEVFFRILLFKLFNKIETWELLEESIGPIEYARYSFDAYDRVLDKAIGAGRRIYSAAYIMPTGGRAATETRKHRLHLRLLEKMIADGLPKKLGRAKSMHVVFDSLLAYPTIGPFLAYQFATDINYSTITNFSEREFVVPGPGALDGINKCFANRGGLTETEIIKLMMDIQESEFERLGLTFRTLWGRPLQLIDCQNLFCEVGKYARVAHPDVAGLSGRTRIKQHFGENALPIQYWYPPKWDLNRLIAAWRKENVLSEK
jgi:thymidylate kinase